MRQDGRKFDEIRKVKIDRGVIKYAEGSCMIEAGDTKLICTASVEKKVPPFLRDTGSGWVTAEYGMLPRSCQTRIQRESSRGRQSGRTYEIQRLIGRSLRSVVDLKKLGERTIWLDCDVLQGDGGTRTAGVTGSFVALIDALITLQKKRIIEVIPVEDYVAAISVGNINGRLCLDMDYQEDSKAKVDMNVVMTGRGRFIEIQGTAERGAFSKKDLDELISLAKKGIKQLINVQRRILKIDF